MAKLKKRAARKTAMLTAKHSLRGAKSKTRRKPLRSGGLVGLGALIGAGVTLVVARGRRPATT